mgnify:FL=1
MSNDKLEQIFNEQRSHMEKYAEIERNNGLLQTPDIPVDLQDRFGQARLKDFAWRISEEMGEALDEIENDGPLEDYHEEMSDVLHFLAEFTILAGLEPKDLITIESSEGYLEALYAQSEQNIHLLGGRPGYSQIAYQTGVFLQKLAMACNLLKNKPWKQSVRETDPEQFRLRLITVWEAYIAVCRVINVGPDKLHQLYFRKSEINKIRQQTGY